MKLKKVTTPNAPLAVGPYSQAIRSGKTIFCSGQIGLDPKTNQLASGGIETETKQVLQNLTAVLEAAGSDKNCVAQCTIFLTDMNNFSKVNKIYESFFSGGIKPARQTVEVSKLPKNASIEISCVAVAKEQP